MIDYGRLTPLLAKAIQDQQAQIEMLKVELGLKDTEAQEQAESMSEQENLNSDLLDLIRELTEQIEQLEDLTGKTEKN